MTLKRQGEFLLAFLRGGRSSSRSQIVTEEYRALARRRLRPPHGEPAGKLQLELKRVLGAK